MLIDYPEYCNLCLKISSLMCFLYNQRVVTCIMFFIIINVLHVSGVPSPHRQEPIQLYVQPWVLSCLPAVYRGVDGLELFSIS